MIQCCKCELSDRSKGKICIGSAGYDTCCDAITKRNHPHEQCCPDGSCKPVEDTCCVPVTGDCSETECCGGTCCGADAVCVLGDGNDPDDCQSCPATSKLCPADSIDLLDCCPIGQCYTSGVESIPSMCCAKPLCAGECCESNAFCVIGTCVPCTGEACGVDSEFCCGILETCCDNVCIDEDYDCTCVPFTVSTCPTGQICCGDGTNSGNTVCEEECVAGQTSCGFDCTVRDDGTSVTAFCSMGAGGMSAGCISTCNTCDPLSGGVKPSPNCNNANSCQDGVPPPNYLGNINGFCNDLSGIENICQQCQGFACPEAA